MSLLALVILTWLAANAVIGLLLLRSALLRDRAARAAVAHGLDSVLGAAERYAGAASGGVPAQTR